LKNKSVYSYKDDQKKELFYIEALKKQKEKIDEYLKEDVLPKEGSLKYSSLSFEKIKTLK